MSVLHGRRVLSSVWNWQSLPSDVLYHFAFLLAMNEHSQCPQSQGNLMLSLSIYLSLSNIQILRGYSSFLIVT
jgi:hypothetical protein